MVKLLNYKIYSTIFVFLSCLTIGFWISTHKAIWNDEFYTAVTSVANPSYKDLLLGNINEGINTPLFYILQKFFCQIIHYQIPPQWIQGHWEPDWQAQIVLRIIPVICISLSMAGIFYYFATFYSFWLATYSLFIYLSSYMLWAYWAEARPYPLIVLLTTAQSLVFLVMTENRKNRGINWVLLSLIHVLMSLTFSFSLGPIIAISLILWFNHEKNWKKYIFLTLLPIAISCYYLNIAPKYTLFSFYLTPDQMIRDNISRDRLYLLGIFLIWISIYGIQKYRRIVKISINEQLLKQIPYFLLTLLLLAFTLAVMGLLALKLEPTGHGTPIISRHFIYLMPIGIIASTLITYAVIKSLSAYRWIQWGMIIIIASLIIPRFFKIAPKAILSIIHSI